MFSLGFPLDTIAALPKNTQECFVTFFLPERVLVARHRGSVDLGQPNGLGGDPIDADKAIVSVFTPLSLSPKKATPKK